MIFLSLAVFADETFKCRKETYVYDNHNGGITSDNFYFINNFLVYQYDFMGRKYLLFYKDEGNDCYQDFGYGSGLVFPSYLGNGHFAGSAYGVGDPPIAKEKRFEEIRYSKTDFYRILADDFYRCYLQKEAFDSDFDCLAEFLNLINIFTKEDLRILRNTIYAKYGYTFKSEDLNIIFSEMDWYSPKKYKGNFEDEFSSLDSTLLEAIKLAEK